MKLARVHFTATRYSLYEFQGLFQYVLSQPDLQYHIARKFGGLAVLGETTKLKSTKIYTACMYVWRYCSRPPNLNPRIHSLGANRQI